MAKARQLGTLLKIGDGATPTEAFTTVAQLTRVGSPRWTNEVISFVDHSAAGRYKEKLTTWLDAGTVEVTGFWDPNDATHDDTTGILESALDGAVRNFQVYFPQFSPTIEFEFAAVVREFGPEPAEAEGGVITFTASLEISGSVTITSA